MTLEEFKAWAGEHFASRPRSDSLIRRTPNPEIQAAIAERKREEREQAAKAEEVVQ